MTKHNLIYNIIFLSSINRISLFPSFMFPIQMNFFPNQTQF